MPVHVYTSGVGTVAPADSESEWTGTVEHYNQKETHLEVRHHPVQRHRGLDCRREAFQERAALEMAVGHVVSDTAGRMYAISSLSICQPRSRQGDRLSHGDVGERDGVESGGRSRRPNRLHNQWLSQKPVEPGDRRARVGDAREARAERWSGGSAGYFRKGREP